MEGSKKRRVVKVALIVVLVCLASLSIARLYASHLSLPRYVSAYLVYIDKVEAIALYDFKVFGGEPEGIEIKECIAQSSNTTSISIPYTFKDLTKPAGVSTGDVLLIQNITKYSNWTLVIYLSGKIDKDEMKPSYAKSIIPSVSNEEGEHERLG